MADEQWSEYKLLVMSELERLDACQVKLKSMIDRALIGMIAFGAAAVVTYIIERGFIK